MTRRSARSAVPIRSTQIKITDECPPYHPHRARPSRATTARFALACMTSSLAGALARAAGSTALYRRSCLGKDAVRPGCSSSAWARGCAARTAPVGRSRAIMQATYSTARSSISVSRKGSFKGAPTTVSNWSRRQSPMPCAACRRRTSRRRWKSTPAGPSCRRRSRPCRA